MQEHCERVGDQDRLSASVRDAGENIRHRRRGRRAGKPHPGRRGDQLTPQRLALLAGQGLAEVEVLRKVRIGLISTGSELTEPGEPLERGQIYNSNRVMIRSMLAACPWAEIVDYRDRP